MISNWHCYSVQFAFTDTTMEIRTHVIQYDIDRDQPTSVQKYIPIGSAV